MGQGFMMVHRQPFADGHKCQCIEF